MNSYNDQDGDDSGDHVEHDGHDHDHDNGEDEKGGKMKSPWFEERLSLLPPPDYNDNYNINPPPDATIICTEPQ